ncbi:phosphoserine phosphatase SerB [Helicobacter muridarum]|uniref:Phosphoserine phosphatase n=1 Tax=Helicobacter muridarum TaxID=216 RepID=A0A099U014_9HELI|nr:phosphoserine phosphatase SerB [Helicobacter muridarum]TLE00744.1 phosphoserine phosphatase SerB [Helicobacter muridarum]STQ86577.1 phosphoserine phosphatase [Helicobacter muridarum]
MLIVFDFDSTLLDGESIDIFARRYNKEKEIASITNEAMQGRMDFFQSLTKRVSMLKGMSLEVIYHSIRYDFHLMNGAKQCVQELRSKGHTIICFSGGFSLVTEYFKDILGLHATFSNVLHSADSKLTGEVGGPMMFGDSKGIMLSNLQGILGVDSKQCVAIGDGANDLSMFEYAETRIAFCAKEILQKAATHCINNKDLREVIEIVDLVSKNRTYLGNI